LKPDYRTDVQKSQGKSRQILLVKQDLIIFVSRLYQRVFIFHK